MAGILMIYQEWSNSIPNFAMLNKPESAFFNTGTYIHCTEALSSIFIVYQEYANLSKCQMSLIIIIATTKPQVNNSYQDILPT